MKWRLIKIGFLICAITVGIVVATLLFLPFRGPFGSKVINVMNLSNARQLAIAVKLYVVDHDGRFPMHLNELEPDYLHESILKQLLYRPNDEKHTVTVYPVRCDWLYFGAFHDEKHPPTILIASPQAFTEDRKSKRVVIYGDISGEILNDEDFQPKLRQTIKELNERAAALMPKQEQTAPPVEQPEVP
jgi:hypothetical protein